MRDNFDTLAGAALSLSPFAVATRYDDAFWPEIEEVRNALAMAHSIQRFVQERFTM